MNCKPGDIAKSIKPGRHYGLLVEILYAAPPVDFRLPDGHIHVACEPGRWVFRVLGLPVIAQCVSGNRPCFYAVGRDIWLRPIRPDAEPETTDEREELTA